MKKVFAWKQIRPDRPRTSRRLRYSDVLNRRIVIFHIYSRTWDFVSHSKSAHHEEAKMDPDEEENPNDFKGANPLEAYSNEDIAGGAVEEETDDFEPDSQLVFQRNGRGSVRQQSFNGGRGRVGSVLASRVLEESEDVIQEEGEDGQFTGDYKGQPPMRTRTRGIAMTKRASTVSINDQEQLILNQVMAKFSGQDKKGASSETEAEDQSNLKASKDAKRTSVKQVKVPNAMLC